MGSALGAGADQYRYVASPGYSGLIAIASRDTGVALQGDVQVRARRDRMTITVDDNVSQGTIHVVITSKSSARHLCIRDNTPTRITGLTPGETVGVWIADAAFRNDCDAGGTTGILTLSQ